MILSTIPGMVVLAVLKSPQYLDSVPPFLRTWTRVALPFPS